MNSLMVIFPYEHEGMWVFDDEKVGLNREPLVAGIPEIIEYATTLAGIDNPRNGFALTFSATPFPEHQATLLWDRQEYDGNFYKLEGTDMEGWLCPALFKYFDKTPKKIYCSIGPKGLS